MKPLLILLVLSSTLHNALADETKPFAARPFKLELVPTIESLSFDWLGPLSFGKSEKVDSPKPKEIKELTGWGAAGIFWRDTESPSK